ncbi:hypothetical protein H0H81_011252 [Sphagnurus paluster]|uniref:Uncharacterized protein n=1 Tax=Sphagnurus paluster TaxID=117069 RepID=A0A9P7GHK5_9AGAR|nr:hypothetical protein H0H81_011252 [Sphagnurus paluster]
MVDVDMEDDGMMLGFGVLALSDLKEGKDIMFEWEWDDGNMVQHVQKTALAQMATFIDTLDQIMKHPGFPNGHANRLGVEDDWRESGPVDLGLLVGHGYVGWGGGPTGKVDFA